MIIDRPKKTQISMLGRLWREAFDDGDFFDDVFLKFAFSCDRCRCLMLDGEIAAALYWFDCTCCGEKIAYLYAIATAKKYRNKGLCKALMNDTHRHLKSLGYKGALLVPGSAELFGFYEKIGYRHCTIVSEFVCDAKGEGIDIKRIGREEYAALRRQYLPDGAVIQEGESLDLLETQASFFAGDDFVMAAVIDDGRLLCTELLGNKDAAPAILAALWCKSGSFRTVGEGKDFAMYLPFDDGGLRPEYFGLAFD
jgi:GNAT superfamily N-acetyltransferase